LPESMSYFGSKNALYQQLINLIPRHRVYVEAFAGSAAVGRHLRPSQVRLFIERDEAQAAWLRAHLASADDVQCDDALPRLRPLLDLHDAFLFLDPPYPIGDRRDRRPRYRCEMTDEQHKQLAGLVYGARAKVMICGFPWGLYTGLFDRVSGWWRHDFEVIQRNGEMGTESVWCNYTEPFMRQDYRYWGRDRKVRQDTRRLVSRTVNKLRRLDAHRRQAVLDAIALTIPSTTGEIAVDRAQAETPSAAATSTTSQGA
jgi:DNA adenine methylase